MGCETSARSPGGLALPSAAVPVPLPGRVQAPERRAPVPKQYVEGPRGEPAGRRLVVAADQRLQQKRA